ncbi:hypothetical protein BH09VER1_BH09VER1_54030 [soil metagenome]
MLGVVALLGMTVGAWAQEAAPTPIDATNLEVLRAQVNNQVIVEGAVTDVGTTKDGGITFINVGLPKKQGFVAVVFKDSYSAFPDGFDKFRSQKVRVKGLMKLYKTEQPEVVISSPDQITIITDPAAPASPAK